MRQTFRFALSCLVVLSVGALASAQDAKPFANEIARSKQAAEEGREQIGLLEFNAKEAGDVAAGDIVEAKKWFEGYSVAWDAAAKEFEQGKQEAGWKAWTVASSKYRDRERWRERIGARQQQAQTAPTEQWAARERPNMTPEVMPLFDKLAETGKGVSAAWGGYAESLTPEATDDDIRLARQRVNVAIAERDIAAARLNWGRETLDLFAARATSKDLDEKLKALEKIQADIEQGRRQRVELDGKLDASEAARRTTLDDARKAADAARKQREEAERNKK